MRVLVLGGAGDMGSGIVRDLAFTSGFDEIHIGDINEEAAERVISSLGEVGERVSYVRVDARDRPGLVRVLRDYDVVANAIGPFYEWGERIARACIEAGVSMVDICDDYDAAGSILELSGEAERAGVTILTGLGWTPGITNVLVRHASQQLDELESVRICWVGSAADSEGLAVIMHVFHAVTGRVPMFLDGRVEQVEAGSGLERVEFPEPIGEVGVFYTGHPEPLTIPRYLRVKRDVTLKGGLVPEWQNGLARAFVRLGLTRTASRKRRLAKIIHAIEGVFRAGGVKASSARVDVEGVKGGEPERLTYAVVDRMYRLTGIPASVGVQMIARGEIEDRGAYPPEAVVEPTRFLEELSRRNVRVLRLEGGRWRDLEAS